MKFNDLAATVYNVQSDGMIVVKIPDTVSGTGVYVECLVGATDLGQ